MASPHITEPMTMVTDYLLAAQCLVQARVLARRAPTVRLGSIPVWVAAFAGTAIAALAGGTAHGFALYLGSANLRLVWTVTVTAIALSGLVMLWAGVRSVRHPYTADRGLRKSGGRWLVRGIGVTLVGLGMQQSGWSPAEHFNHNDLYHVIQMAGLYCFYRGALALHEM